MSGTSLPNTGFVRESHLIGRKAITPEQAEINRAAGKRGRRPREAQPGLLPVCSATLWRMVTSGRFPSPVRLPGGRVTAWRVEDVRAWIAAQGAQR